MKVKISPAVIMRTKAFGESDLMVQFFTPEGGRLKGVAKGARKSRRRFVNCFDIFSLVHLEYEFKRGGDVCLLHSGKLIDAYMGLRSEYTIFSKASFIIELTEVLFPYGVADRGAFELLKDSLDALSKKEKIDLIPTLVEVKIMALGGYGMNLERCCICGRPYKGEGRAVSRCDKGGIACLRCTEESILYPGLDPQTIKVMTLMRSRPLSELKRIAFTEKVLMEIKPVLQRHREYHLGQRLKTACLLG